MRDFLTVKEVAEELRTTERTIRELIKKKDLQAKKVGTKSDGVKCKVTINKIKTSP